MLMSDYPQVTSWLCDVVAWEDVKDIPTSEQELLYLNLAKMDNWETSVSSVVATEWERFLFCKEHIFTSPVFTK
jgi:hypothetical protein